MVILELEYLYEIKRISSKAAVITESLEASIGLRVCKLSFHRLVMEAIMQTWARDPFDRMIAANAICSKSRLLTKDAVILSNCINAVWEE
jgi:PIN domain nuclease of toxin-antitoxin system